MNRHEMLLVQVGEEAAEVTQAASKVNRFSPLEVFKGQKFTNAERLIIEFYELYQIIEMLQRERVLPIFNRERIDSICEAKREKVEKLLCYSEEIGTLYYRSKV